MEKEWPEWYFNNAHDLEETFIRMGKACASKNEDALHWFQLAEMVPKIAVERLSDTEVWVRLVTQFVEDPCELIKALAIIQCRSLSRDDDQEWMKRFEQG